MRHFRRERMSYDGLPPSMLENQVNFYGGWRDDSGRSSVLPRDYMYYAPQPSGGTWPAEMIRCII
jgi:hypothetical protein